MHSDDTALGDHFGFHLVKYGDIGSRNAQQSWKVCLKPCLNSVFLHACCKTTLTSRVGVI